MREADAGDLVKKLKEAAGDNLRTVVVYGSAASGEFRPKHSDLNILCLLRQAGASDLSRLHHAAQWWIKKGHPAPLIFTLQELQRAADVYAIELLEIKSRRKVLYGEDVFTAFDVPMNQYRLQLERELRHNLVRLRQGYLSVAGKKRAVISLMSKSASTFAALFRHALIALGEQPPPTKHEAVERLSALLGFSTTSFSELFRVRTGERNAKSLDPELIFRDYLEAVSRAVDEITVRLAP